jgi:hypothetical protein
MAAVVTAPIASAAEAPYSSPVRVAAWRPRTVERSSSARPLSSSARVWRTTRNRTIRQIPSWATCEISFATMPPSVSIAACRPDMRWLTGLAPTALA